MYAQSNNAVSIFEKLSVIETEYFDIIFPDESTQTAEYLAVHADDLYLKAADFLYVENLVRMPVVITQKTDVLNAYFTILPYSRIVIYDTLPTEPLAVFDDTLLSVFYHELVHAISLKNSQKNVFLLDDMTPIFTLLEMPPSMSEGTAVLAESLDGKGRLNSAYSTLILRQAKIENKFPDWSDIAGSYSLYTDSSLPYIFGGAFMDYMYTTYGAFKLSEFWAESAKVNLTLYTQSFKNVYGISIEDAWDDFRESIVVPELTDTPIPFYTDKKDATYYDGLAASPYGFAWQDYFSNDIFFSAYNDESYKDKKLYSTDLSDRLHFSQDGRYLSISGTTGLDNAENKTIVFDMYDDSIERQQKNLRDGAVIDMSKTYIFDRESPFYDLSAILAGIETRGQNAYLSLYDLKKAESSTPLLSIPFEFGAIAFDPVDAGNGRIITLVYNNGEWNFFLYDAATDERKMYKLPSEYGAIVNVSAPYATSDTLYMSFAKDPQSQPVLAKISLRDFLTNTLTLHVQKGQRSGGVFYPVVIDAHANENATETFAYISRFYETRALSTMTVEESDYDTYNLERFYPDIVFPITQNFERKNYNPLKYYFDGMFIPFIGSVNLTPIDSELATGFSLGSSAYFLDPVERLLIGGGAGYDVLKHSFTATASTIFTNTNLMLTGDAYIELDESTLETSATKLFGDLSFPIFSDYNRLGFSNTFRLFYQRETSNFLYEGLTIDNMAAVYFSHIKLQNESYYSRRGLLLLNQVYTNKYLGTDIRVTNDTLFGNIASAEIYVPFLIPVKNPSRFTVNLPFSISFLKFFNYDADWEIQGKAVLFAYEVQKAIPLIHIFLQRLTLDGGTSYISYKDGTDALFFHSNIYATMALNAGLGAGYPVDVGLSLIWDMQKQHTEALKLELKFALNL